MFSLMIFFLGAGPLQAAPLLEPDARGFVSPDRNFDIQTLTLNVSIDPEARTVAGHAIFDVERLFPGSFVLDQVDLDIQSVTSGDLALAWSIRGDTLRIEVPEGVSRVQVAYAAMPDTGLHFRSRAAGDAVDEVWTQGEAIDHRHWFPSWDHPDDRLVYEGEIKFPDGWSVIVNTGMEMVNYLVMVAASPDYVQVRHPDDETISVWVPEQTSSAAIGRVLDPLPAMMEHMGSRAGMTYPWGPYRQIFVQRFLYGGMENTSATIETVRMLHEAETADSEWVESVVAHELAHQWYGDLLTCRDWRELWLNEGFATFMAADWLRQSEGDAHWAAKVDGWFSASRSESAAMSGSFHQGSDQPAGHRVYVKGASVLRQLQVMLGDEVFWKGIVHYTTTHQNDNVDSHDLRRSMEHVSGQRLEWFFQQWVELPHTPHLTISHKHTSGELVVRVGQEVTESRPRYTVPFALEIGLADGTVLQRRAWLEDELLHVNVSMDSPPLYVAFDPEGGVLAEVDQQQDVAEWISQLQSSHPYARRMAMKQLGEEDAPEALATILLDASSPRADRVLAAKMLGKQREESVLLSVVEDPDSHVRKAAAAGLSKGTGAAATRALAQRVQVDDDPAVQAAALSSLARRDAAAALRLARRLTDSDSMIGLNLSIAAIEIIGKEGRASDLARLLQSGRLDRLDRNALTAAVALAVRLDEDGDQASVRVARVLESRLDDVDLRTRQTVVRLLGMVGDERSIEALEVFRRQERVDHLADDARDSIHEIRRRSNEPDRSENESDVRIEELTERLEALEDQLRQLQDRH